MDPAHLKALADFVYVSRNVPKSLQLEDKSDDGRDEDRDRVVRRRGTIQKDDGNSNNVTTMPGTLQVMHRALRGARLASKPIQAWLSFYEKSSGAANTAFSWNTTVRPNQDSSWASWQAVFDEVKVISAECIWLVCYTTIESAQAAQTPNAVVVYEPTDTPSITSVNVALQYEHFQLLNVGSSSKGLYPTIPMATSKGGYQIFKVKIPSGVVQSTTDTVLSTGMWRPTSDAGNYYWGQFSGYCAEGGTSAVIQVERFIRMRCEFRTRR